MSDWKQKIEAQIEQLWDAANYFDTEGRPDETIMGIAATSLKALLDVAIAAEEYDGTSEDALIKALDKLREVSDED